jgi:hypothetical protein
MPDFMFFPAVSSVYLVQHEYEILREAKVKIDKYMLIIFLSRLLNIHTHPISHPNTLVFVVAEPVALRQLSTCNATLPHPFPCKWDRPLPLSATTRIDPPSPPPHSMGARGIPETGSALSLKLAIEETL